MKITGGADPSATTASDSLLAAKCAELFADAQVPGMAAAVVRSNGETEIVTLGKSDVARDWAVDADTVFRIGSVGKTMTAIAVMQLVEAGKLSIDDTVNEHLHSIKITGPRNARPVTVKDLLTHTSGLGPLRRTSDLVRPLTGLGAPVGQVPELNDYYRAGLRAVAAPGTRWSYANHGFTVLGQLISDVSGVPYREYMATRVFAPLGMSQSSLRLTPALQGHLAVGYAKGKRGFTPVKYLDIVVEPAGAVFSNVKEMSLYLEALLGGGANRHGRVLQPETLETMTRTHFTGDARLAAGFGLGFMTGSMADHRNFWHSGGWPGFGTMLQVFPADGVGIVLLGNALSKALAGAAEGLARFMLGEKEAAPSVEASPVTKPASDLIAGTYAPLEKFVSAPIRWMTTGGGGFRIAAKDGTLQFRTRIPVGPGRHRASMQQSLDDPFVFETVLGGQHHAVAFQTDHAGQVTGMCVDGILTFRKI